MICVAESTVNDVATVDPATAVARVNRVPVIVTEVPPACGPLPGLTLVTVGGGLYINSSHTGRRRPTTGVVTVMSTVPLPAGAVAVIWVGEWTVNEVALVVPNLTERWRRSAASR